MAVLALVVDRGASLDDLLQGRGVEHLAVAGGAQHVFGEGERGATVAVGHARQHGAGLGVERQRAAELGLGAGEQALDRHLVERLEHQYVGSRQERGVELERRVLGGGADQHDGAVLHHGEETVELGAIEAMDLVDEEQRAPTQGAAAARRLEHLLEIGDAGEDRRDLLELEIGLVGEEAGDGGLAGAGRPPEDQRAERARAQHASDGAVGADEVVLADHLGEGSRPQPIGERTRGGAIETGGGEEIGHGRRTPRS